jgi:hypothetical protein
MKKAEKKREDDLRPEYQRSDFGAMARGKHAAQANAASNVVVLEPEVARAFPNDKAVNDALKALIEIAKAATQG